MVHCDERPCAERIAGSADIRLNTRSNPAPAVHAESSKATIPAIKASLGFGCAALPVDQPRIARAILDHAFELGIRHFDVARLYGYGEAERILGDFLRGIRSEVTITTKCGLILRVRTITETLKARTIRELNRFPPVEDALRLAKHAVIKPAQNVNFFITIRSESTLFGKIPVTN